MVDGLSDHTDVTERTVPALQAGHRITVTGAGIVDIGVGTGGALISLSVRFEFTHRGARRFPNAAGALRRRFESRHCKNGASRRFTERIAAQIWGHSPQTNVRLESYIRRSRQYAAPEPTLIHDG